MDQPTINAAFRKLLGLASVTVENLTTVAETLGWHEQGLDFADALHLASSQGAEGFATFDRALAKKAQGLPGTLPVIMP